MKKSEWTFKYESGLCEWVICWNEYFPVFCFRHYVMLTGKGKFKYCWAEGGIYSRRSVEFNTKEEMEEQIIEDCTEFLKKLTA